MSNYQTETPVTLYLSVEPARWDIDMILKFVSKEELFIFCKILARSNVRTSTIMAIDERESRNRQIMHDVSNILH